MSLPIIWDLDTPRARPTDPITSHEAATAAEGKRLAAQAIVLRILRDSTVPLTDAEIRIEAAWDGIWSPERLRTARHELVEQGKVRAAGLTTLPGHRTRMLTWTVTA